MKKIRKRVVSLMLCFCILAEPFIVRAAEPTDMKQTEVMTEEVVTEEVKMPSTEAAASPLMREEEEAQQPDAKEKAQQQKSEKEERKGKIQPQIEEPVKEAIQMKHVVVHMTEGRGEIRVENKEKTISYVSTPEAPVIEMELPAGTVLNIKAVPDNGYEISQYRVLIDGGTEKEKIQDKGILTAESSFQKELLVEENLTVEITAAEKLEEKGPGDDTQEEKQTEEDKSGSGVLPLDKETINPNLLCDDPNCLTEHVGKTLDPSQFQPVMEGGQVNLFRAAIFPMAAKINNPHVGMQTSGIAAIQFDGWDWGAPGTFTLTFLNGDLAGHVFGGAECLNHGAANPGDGNTPQGDYVATITSMDTTGGSITWSIIVTPPGACAEGSVYGYQRVGGAFTIPYSFNGSLELLKTSSNPELTDGNSCYSLEGAVYGVYKNSACTNQAGTLTTAANGKSNKLTLVAGDYWVKEITAPKGFALDATVHKVTVTAGQTATVNVTDKAQSDPIPILLGKVDAVTNQNKPQGSASLANAEFTIKYYSGFYDTDPAQQGISAIRTWVIKTREDGKTLLSDTFKVSGDAFYYSSFGAVTLPLGTITIKETKAPTGYLTNNTVFVRKITSAGDAEAVNTYNQPEIPETIIKGGVAVEKWDNGLNAKNPQGKATLQGAKIQIISRNEEDVIVDGTAYSNGEVIRTLTTDATGAASTSNNYLPYGDYGLREASPPTGYLNTGVIERTFSIRENGKIVQMNTSGTAIKNDVIRGGVMIEKWDNETDERKAQGGASLAGAKIQIISLNDNPVIVEGRQYQKNEVIHTFTTDANGRITTANNYLPYGDYKAKELSPPTGYLNTGVIERSFSIRENGKIIQMNTSGTAIKNDVIRGDIQLVKFRESTDEDQDQKEPLEGIAFHIRKDKNGEPGDIVKTIVTAANGYASTVDKNHPRGGLVYGDYWVEEDPTTTPEGAKPVETFKVTITKEGVTLYYILEDKNILSPVTVVKKDATTGQIIPVADTEFQLLDKDKKPITMKIHYPETVTLESFKTNENGQLTFPEKLVVGTYFLKEVNAPKGYLKGELLEFKITAGHNWEDPLIVEYEDEPAMGRIKVQKSDAVTGEALAGAVFEIRAAENIITPDGTLRLAKGEVADTITTGTDGIAISKLLYLGDYVTQEIQQPDGYILNDTEYVVELKYVDQLTPIVIERVDVTNFPTVLKIIKIDKETKEPMPGVKYKVWNKAAIEPFVPEIYDTDESGIIFLKYQPAGTYCFQEAETLPGYILDETIYELTISEDGCINGEEMGVLELENDFTKVEISKTDITTGEELPGAELEIQDTSGEIIRQWTSGDKPHYMDKLLPGDYVLVETAAPAGYLIAEKIPFTVEATGEIQKVQMEDDVTKVEISKVDITTGKELPGAKLEIQDSSGEVIRQWTSGEKPYYMDKLLPGDYVLVETAAPAGYLIAERIPFTVEATGEIQKVQMEDDVTKVEISKVDITTGKELPGAKLEIQDSSGEVIRQWTSGEKPYYMDKLPEGDYVLVETAAPDGYVIAEKIPFTVEATGHIQKVQMEDDVTKVEISKVDITTGKELPGARLEIQNPSGEVIRQWTTGEKPQYFEKLPVGDYVLIEIAAPKGYVIAEKIPFTVRNTGEIQRVRMEDERKIGKLIPRMPGNQGSGLVNAYRVKTGDQTSPFLAIVLITIAGPISAFLIGRRIKRRRSNQSVEG